MQEISSGTTRLKKFVQRRYWDTVESEQHLESISHTQMDSNGDATTVKGHVDTALEFLQPFKLHSTKLIDSEYPISQEYLEEHLQEESQSYTSGEGDTLDRKYKEDAANYWRSGKKKRLSVELVQRIFRRVNSLRQLYSWGTNLEKGGAQTEKLSAIGLNTVYTRYRYTKMGIKN
ncbi:hypothetical protein Trydic_g11106 [Trypoxylus dichotomus]